jgi:uncharacterized membrane protein YdjX (TVP38/TMEM64 family)
VQWLILGIVIVLVGAYFFLGLNELITLEKLKELAGILPQTIEEKPLMSGLVFFIGYIVMAALSLPGAAIMTLAAGALFGLGWGLLLVSFASSIGATLAFLVARTLLGKQVEQRFGTQLEAVNAGLQREGNFYLFSIRMVPLFPFFLVNLVMGLTSMRAIPFYVVSQLGMFAGTLVFVFAGTELVKLDSVSDVLNPGLILALTLLGLFPLIAKRLLKYASSRRSHTK